MVSFVIHGLLLAALMGLIGEPTTTTKQADDTPMRVRILDESELPSSLRRKVKPKKRLTERKKRQKEPQKPKPKKKFKDPRWLTYQPVETNQAEENPQKANYSGRYATKTAQDQIKRGTEGDPSARATKETIIPTPTQRQSRQATDTKKRFKQDRKITDGQLKEQTTKPDQPNIKSSDFAPEPDIVLPKEQRAANSKDIKLGQRKQSGSTKGDPNANAKQLFPSLRNTQALAKKRGNNGTFDLLKNVPDANRTLLNRKKNRYWTFFDRIKRQLGRQWNPVKVYNKRDPYRNIYGTKDRYAILDVTLKGNGKVHKLHVSRSSGLDFYDDEAVRAMLAAAPFPNPPEGLKDEDGFIHFKFGFLLTIETGSSRLFRLR